MSRLLKALAATTILLAAQSGFAGPLMRDSLRLKPDLAAQVRGKNPCLIQRMVDVQRYADRYKADIASEAVVSQISYAFAGTRNVDIYQAKGDIGTCRIPVMLLTGQNPQSPNQYTYRDAFIVAQAQALAKRGYVVFVPDYLQGVQGLANFEFGNGAHWNRLRTQNQADLGAFKAVFDAQARSLRVEGSQLIAAGLSYGGNLALYAAHLWNWPVSGVMSASGFIGVDQTNFFDAAASKGAKAAPWLVAFHHAADPIVPYQCDSSNCGTGFIAQMPVFSSGRLRGTFGVLGNTSGLDADRHLPASGSSPAGQEFINFMLNGAAAFVRR